MDKSKNISLFLAFMLIAGTIATFFSSSSFTKEVHALSNYELMKRDDYNSKYVQYNKENIDCTNFNLNGNGLDINTIPESLSGLAAVQGETDSENGISAYATEENRFGSYDKDFLYNCINNNDNELIVSPIPSTPPPVDECLLCFEETTQAVRDAINAFLAAQRDIPVAPGIVIPADVNNFEQLCEWLTENAPLELTETQINNLISQFLRANPTLDREEVQELVECLIDADLIELTTCDDCFAALPDNVQAAVNSILETIPPGGLPQDTTPPLIIPTTVGSIQELCEFLESNTRGVTPEQRESLITTFADVPGSSQEIATALIDCLIDVGIFNLVQPE